MKKKPENEVDALFKHTTQATKDLHKAAKKHLRKKQRKEWYAKYGKGNS